MKSFGTALLAAVILGLGGGCKKSPPESGRPATPPATNQPPATIAQVHWLGKKRIGAETNAANFMTLWNLPESATLEAQTLDKLALAIAGAGPAAAASARSLGTNQAALATNYHALAAGHAAAARIRPLLDDLVREEWYLEMRQEAGPPAELALAIRLAGQRAGLWTSNLSAALGSLTNVQSLPAATNRLAWRLPLDPRPSRLELARAGDWTLLGLAGERNSRLDDFAARIQRDKTPVAGAGTGSSLELNPVTRELHPATNTPPPVYWLEALVDLKRAAGALALGPQPPAALPKMFLAVAGNGPNVRTRANLEFPERLPLEFEPWNIPTNLIHDPLIGFAAARGIRPWLKSFKPWQELALGTPPNQAFFWAQAGNPSLHFVAAPSVDASNQVNRLSDFVLRELNPILATNALHMGVFARQTNAPGLVWRGIPWFSPRLDYADSDGRRYLIAGLARNSVTNRPAPPGLFHYLQSNPNLVAYDWEATQPCLDSWTQMGQLTRHVCSLARMTQTAGFIWLAALSPRLTNSITAMELTSPTELSFVRISTAGFTGAELHLLADWLESLEFPRGLHSFTAPVPPPPVRPRTNAPPSIQPTNSPAP